ncbi:hypothetical protein G5672_24940, partial [Escherichia coli]|nr:hypothetical protein [Escherichia coli]
AASMTPLFGQAVANKITALVDKANKYPSGIGFKINQPEHLAQRNVPGTSSSQKYSVH